MIKLEHTEVLGWEHSVRGMRNPKNSWDKSDSCYCNDLVSENDDGFPCKKCRMFKNGSCTNRIGEFIIGQNDYDLMKRLVKAGTDHSKFMRMITVYVDITAPLYWWKEFDTYKIGTVANSCSTMHKIADKEFTLDNFSHEHLYDDVIEKPFKTIIDCLNFFRTLYLNNKNKEDWWQMIQLLPSSYNQKRTIMLNYAVLRNMYHARKSHQLDEWHDFCKWIESLPYSELITTEVQEAKTLFIKEHNQLAILQALYNVVESEEEKQLIESLYTKAYKKEL